MKNKIGDSTYRPTELDTVTVEYKGGKRLVSCFCGEKVLRSIVPHFKTQHSVLWQQWVALFAALRSKGYPLKRIMRLFKAGNKHLLFSWTVIERAIKKEVENGTFAYRPPPRDTSKPWNPKDFERENTTLWDFPRRGDWAVHSGDYRGNWPPQIPRNLIERYTKAGDLVVDAFAGGGTTLIEAWLLGRPSVGLDVSKLAIQTTKARLAEMHKAACNGDVNLDASLKPKLVKMSASKLQSALKKQGFGPGRVRLICVHPPYLDSLPYTIDNKDDLSLISDPGVFCKRITRFARKAKVALVPGGACAVLIGDVRKNGNMIPLGFQTLQSFLSEGFELESIIVKTQHKDRSTEFYFNKNGEYLQLAHEYLFILQNPVDTEL